MIESEIMDGVIINTLEDIIQKAKNGDLKAQFTNVTSTSKVLAGEILEFSNNEVSVMFID